MRLIVLLSTLLASVAFGQINVPPETLDRHPIVASIDMVIPEGADVQGPGWILPDGVRGIPCDRTTMHLWTDPGEHKIGYKIFWIHITEFTFTDGAGKEITIKQYMGHGYVEESATFVVLGEKPKPKPDDPPDPVASRVTYVYEKDVNPVPPAVAAALNELNANGWTASEFEEDTRDGTGQVPDQYAVALREAQAKGLPALVVETPSGVVVVSNPKTRADVIDAVQKGVKK